MGVVKSSLINLGTSTVKQDNPQQAGLLGYIAGFFDGEGNIGSGTQSGPNRNAFFLKMSFSQNDYETLEVVRQRVYETTGLETGKLQVSKGHNKLSAKACYHLSYQGGKAFELAKAILPWSVFKREHLQWIIYTWENRMLAVGKFNNIDFLLQQHLNRPGRRAAAETNQDDTLSIE